MVPKQHVYIMQQHSYQLSLSLAQDILLAILNEEIVCSSSRFHEYPLHQCKFLAVRGDLKFLKFEPLNQCYSVSGDAKVSSCHPIG